MSKHADTPAWVNAVDPADLDKIARRAGLSTEDLVANLSRGKEIPIGDDGLHLRAQGGAPTFIVRYRWQDKRPRYRIGPIDIHPDVGAHLLLAAEVRKKARAGIDPEEARRKLVAPTFGEHAEAYMARHLPTMKNKSSAAKWRGSLTNHCKPIWNLKVDAIERKDVLAVLEPIWKKIQRMAPEVRSRIENILDDAAARGFRSADNPADWTKTLEHALGGKPARNGSIRGSMASVPFKEMPALIAELDSRKTQTTRALIAIAMTCVRTQEFIGMRMSELDLEAEQPTWTIPYQRFKVDPHKTDFVLPLAPQVVRVLREQIASLEEVVGQGKVDYLWPSWVKFKGGREPETPYISNATMLNYLKRSMGLKATVHGFRASFKTWTDDQFVSAFTHPHFAEQLEEGDTMPKYHRHAVEFCLAHAPGGATERAYRRGMMFNSRVAIMRDWANYLMPPSTANVVPFAPREGVA